MIYGSVCSGIEAATVAWHPLGWRAALYADIDAFPCAVLNHYYPTVPNHGDMNLFKEWPHATLDLLVGGTPCQSFSVAGLRKGLDDPRGNLTLVYLAVADKYRPRWVVWENVAGVLSDGTGAFGAFLGGLGQLGYGFAYRVLDAKYFGVPQRRRRVFVVGHLGDWRRAAAVLFELASLRGDLAPSRQSRERLAPTIAARTRGGGGLGTDFDCDGGLITHSLRADGFDASEDGTGRGTPLVPMIAFSCKDSGNDAGELAPTLRAMNAKDGRANPNGGGQVAVAIDWQNSAGGPNSEDAFSTLCKDRSPAVMSAMQVRRLTPRECERLQGFPDDHTLIPYRGKLAADGPRYKALGNSMAVPVMRWLGERIQAVEAITASTGDTRRD